MGEIIYRLAQDADLARTYEVFVIATNDLLARRNLPLIAYSGEAPPRSLAFRRHALKHDGRRYWVAEADGTVVGFGVATLRESLWYLAALHVIPGYQSRGVGRQLLALCLSPDNAPNAKTWIVISDSLNPDSNALYAKRGMYQSIPLLSLDGRMPSEVENAAGWRADRFKRDDPRLAELDTLDRLVLGVQRSVDHAMWLAQPDLAGYFYYAGDQIVGYAYVSNQGGVGPVAVRETEHMEPVLTQCIRTLQAMQVATAAFKIPASNHAGLTYLLRRGFRYHHILLVDASQPFGRLENYLVSVGEALF